MTQPSTLHVCSRAVIIDDGHILLTYDPRPRPYHYYALNERFYTLPGGHVEHRESAPHALVREIKEETGLTATIDRFLGILEHAWSFPGDEVCCHTHEINLVFSMTSTHIKRTRTWPRYEDHVAFEWVSMDQWASIDVRPALLKTTLPRWLKDAHCHPFFSTIS